MPPVIAAAAAVAQGIAGAFFAVGGAIGLSAGAAATFAVFATNALAYATNMYLLGRVNRALAPKAPRGGVAGGQGMEVNYYDSAADGRIIVGTVKVGGVQVIPPITTGSSNEYLHQILALAIHEVDGFDDVYFDQDLIESGWIGSVSGAGTDGAVSTGAYATKTNIRRYTGTSTQSVDYILNAADPTAFPSTFRGRGVAYAAIRYEYDDKVYRSIPNATFEVRGLKCYDPRLDTTNGGSGSHRYATPSTWAYTENPALIFSTLAMSSMMWELDPATEIIWSLVSAAANICDASVNIPGSTTQPRYTANGVLLANNDPEENARLLADAMLGRWFFRDGALHMYAGAYTTPSFVIEKSDWIGPLTIGTVQPRGEGRWNGVRCFFVDADKNTQRKECYARTNSTYTTQDGNDRIWIEMEQPLCNNEYEAQRKAEMILRQSRNQIRISGRLKPKFQTLGTFETGTVTFDDLGWASKVFRLVDWDLNEDGSVSVAIVEEQSSDWDDMDAADYGTASTAALPATNPTSPTAPQSFSVTPQINGTLLFEWARSVIEPVGTVYQLIRSVNSANAAVGTVVWEGAQAQRLPLVMPTSPHFYSMRARTGSYFSAYTPNTFGIFGAARPEAMNVNLGNIVPDNRFVFGSQGSYWQFSATTLTDLTNTYSIGSNAEGGYYRVTRSGSAGNQSWSLRTIHDPTDTTSYAGGLPVGGAYPRVFRTTARILTNSAPYFFSIGVLQSYYRQEFGWVDGSGGHEQRYSTNSSLGYDYRILGFTGAYIDLSDYVVVPEVSVTSYGILRVFGYIQASVQSGQSADLQINRFDVEEISVNYPIVTETNESPSFEFEWSDVYKKIVTVPSSGTTNYSMQLVTISSLSYDRMPNGSIFNARKGALFAPVRIVANSPYTLGFNGSLVNTVTMVASLYGEATITKLSRFVYLVEGTGLA